MKKTTDNIQIEAETKQRRLFKKKRGGEELTEKQVREIKEGRKKLRKQMKEHKVYNKKDFELTASGMGLYFDKHRGLALLLWFLHGRALAALLGALLALLLVLFIFSLVTQLRGHFTISLNDDMFRNGFVLSEEITFQNPTSHLYSDPVENVPCISISSIPEDIDGYDGKHNGEAYFAYTFYVRNEGEDTVDYAYELAINSESKNLSCAAWVMLFEDGKMVLYAEKGDDGEAEALPALDDNRRGYRKAPLIEQAANPEKQYQVVATSGDITYYRVLPEPFVNETVITTGKQEAVAPMEVHKYTVVMWLEGDDPDCTNDLIGGHLGVEMNFRLPDEEDSAEEKDVWTSIRDTWNSIWDNLNFWED